MSDDVPTGDELCEQAHEDAVFAGLVVAMGSDEAALAEMQRRASAEPECGVDFCDDCGDCLHCYGGDDGVNKCADGHNWATFRERIDAGAAAPQGSPGPRKAARDHG